MKIMEELELKPERHYDRVHAWLRSKYGSANKCESNKCSGKSNSFHWAKIHGEDYEYNRDNFIMLCQSCHKIYDMTNYTRIKMSESKKGSKHSRSKLTECDVLKIRSENTGKRNYSSLTALKYNVSYHTINYILKRRTWTHI